MLSSVFVVPAGEVGVVTTLGKVSNTPREPGLNLKLPFIQSTHNFSVRTQVIAKILGVQFRRIPKAPGSDLNSVFFFMLCCFVFCFVFVGFGGPGGGVGGPGGGFGGPGGAPRGAPKKGPAFK